MVCTANDLLVWKDFPKGLRVLLLDEDPDSASDIRLKLEEMDYVVSTFCNENEALLAVSNKLENFHVALVEVSKSNSPGIYKLLETATELPTIMTSKIHCLNTIMKCIALGAVEFLQKPLSEDKLRNIWQHVVHKAFNAKGSVISESLKPIKELAASMLQPSLENGELRNHIFVKEESESQVHESSHEQSAGNEKYPAPSTPQLKQGGRLLIDGDSQDQTNCSSEKDCADQDGECKFVETTCGSSVVVQEDLHQRSGDIVIKEETNSADGPKSKNNLCLHQQDKDGVNILEGDAEKSTKMSTLQNRRAIKANRKKVKIDWTPELHKKFVHALEQLGVDQAIPSRILELMNVKGLTRHNVASHLQKYRMHQRHILPKQDGARCSHTRVPLQSVCHPHKSIMAYPPYHSPLTFPSGQVWGHPISHPSGFHMWGPLGYPAWQPAETWHWNPYSPNACGIYNGSGVDSSCTMPQSSFDLHPGEDVVDKVVREGINKPWLPLPLGLTPPSTDTILTELSKQGISAVPHTINSSNPH